MTTSNPRSLLEETFLRDRQLGWNDCVLGKHPRLS